MTGKKKLLAYHLGSLGDTIVSIPALRMLRDNFHDHEIVLLYETTDGRVAPPEVIPPGLVDGWISYRRRGSGSLAVAVARLAGQIRRERFDAAAYLVFSERPTRSVLRDRAFFRACGIKSLFGFRTDASSDLSERSASGPLPEVRGEAERRTERLGGDGLEVRDSYFTPPWIVPAEEDLALAEQWLAQHKATRPIVAIGPGCKAGANQWPLERFSDLIRIITPAVGTVIIVGGKAEREFGQRMAAAFPGVLNAAGKFSVPETAALLSISDGYVGLNTGPTHLAAAVGTPLVGIYGQHRHPGLWSPTGNQVELIRSPPVACAGCRLESCSLPEHPCMEGIEVSVVAAAIVRMLDTCGVRSRRHFA